MRAIKFRGKEINNGEWVYGDLILGDCFPKRVWISSIHDRERLRSIDSGTKKAIFRAYEVDPETVGQFTGLKDYNGKEIYEGDILRVTDEADEVNVLNSDTGIGVVEWLDKWGFWNISNIENGLGDILNWGHAEVIGNIHDNPESLKEVK